MTLIHVGLVKRSPTYVLALPAVKKQLDLSLDAEQEVLITGHALLLHEMISNLLDNAIRYTPLHGRIALTLSVIDSTPEPYALLVLEDSDPGIAAGEREKVFDPFYRALSASVSNPSGTGLGLSIVRDIVSLHQGQIRLPEGGAAADGKGLRIELLLPL